MIIGSSARCASLNDRYSTPDDLETRGGGTFLCARWKPARRRPWRWPAGSESRQQGINGEFSRKSAAPRENRHENNREFSNLREGQPHIPCATEPGTNSTQQGIDSALRPRTEKSREHRAHRKK
jgi:hypothetical protein